MIPAGIRHGEVEFFSDNGQLATMYNGELTEFEVLPEVVYNILDNHIDHKRALALDRMGIQDPMERRKQFCKCNLASYDFAPDIRLGSDSLQFEYVECTIRENCSYMGLLCQPITINGHRITMAELKISSLIRHGFYDKEICNQLGIAADTLRTHKSRVQRKLGASRKTQIATQSIKYGIS